MKKKKFLSLSTWVTRSNKSFVRLFSWCHLHPSHSDDITARCFPLTSAVTATETLAVQVRFNETSQTRTQCLVCWGGCLHHFSFLCCFFFQCFAPPPPPPLSSCLSPPCLISPQCSSSWEPRLPLSSLSSSKLRLSFQVHFIFSKHPPPTLLFLCPPLVCYISLSTFFPRRPFLVFVKAPRSLTRCAPLLLLHDFLSPLQFTFLSAQECKAVENSP